MFNKLTDLPLLTLILSSLLKQSGKVAFSNFQSVYFYNVTKVWIGYVGRKLRQV